jgi:hypothetical protein
MGSAAEEFWLIRESTEMAGCGVADEGKEDVEGIVENEDDAEELVDWRIGGPGDGFADCGNGSRSRSLLGVLCTPSPPVMEVLGAMVAKLVAKSLQGLQLYSQGSQSLQKKLARLSSVFRF